MTIDGGEVHVWYTRADVDEPVVRACEALLTDAERTKAARFLDAADRRRSIVARASLRMLLGRYTRTEARAVSIVSLDLGKPVAPELPIEFSISHSGSLVALAFSATAPVGIDVERHREVREAAAIARRYFSDHEQRALREAGYAVDAFMRIWVRREALGKALGTGIAAALPPRDPSGDEWSILPLSDPTPGYVAAVAARMSRPTVRIAWLSHGDGVS